MTSQPSQGPIVIAGMHRSGTSLLALILQRIGVDLGDELIPADALNPDGYGEDKPVLKLQREALQRQGQGQGGWADWGWTKDPLGKSNQWADDKWFKEASTYLHKRKKLSKPWGWKDPRSTLFLEQWLKLSPEMKVIAVYRDPWEVTDALQRVHPPIFAAHPEWGLQLWTQYNEALSQFILKHPKRCILIHSSTLTKTPEKIVHELKEQWGLFPDLTGDEIALALENLVRPEKLRAQSFARPLGELHQACSPEAAEVLNTLDRLGKTAAIRGLSSATSYKQEKHLRLMHKPRLPEVSIIITSYNQGDLLIEALASVEWAATGIHQTELAIVDDGSDQARTLEILDHLESLGYTIIRQANQGLPAARNTGIAATQAPLIIFLDDDNRLLVNYLKFGTALMRKHPDVHVVYGNLIEFGCRQRLVRVGPGSTQSLRNWNYIDNCTLMRREFLDRCGGYDTSLCAYEDWDLWLTALEQPEGLTLGYLDMTCFEYRVRPGSMLQRLHNDPSLHHQVMSRLRQKHGPLIGQSARLQ